MQEVDVIFSMELCIVMLGNASSVILHEMTNYLLCMSPVKTSNSGCRLKRLRG